MAATTALKLKNPTFCQYPGGKCDQDFAGLTALRGFFIYPTEPQHLAHTVQEAVRQLQKHSSEAQLKTWRDLNVGGHIVFCELCKAMRSARLIVANITNLNFNVLFELGYAFGLGKSVLPVRDVSFEKEKLVFDEIGIFDTLGYESFHNSTELASIAQKDVSPPFIAPTPEIDRKQPIYLLKSPIESDGSVKLSSALARGYLGIRTFDPRETARLSLHEAYTNVARSVGVVAHLLDPGRAGAKVHNARIAFVCGMAMASEKHVLMLQEGFIPQPIDYRDVIVSYNDPRAIPSFVDKFVRATADTFQQVSHPLFTMPRGVLEKVDLGDVAAENEVLMLNNYFVKTPQFQQARQGHARLVVGRKGAGKTAVFYGVRSFLKSSSRNITLELKPEGHQFTKLRELILAHLSEGAQLHTLTSFWHYLLFLELGRKLLETDANLSCRSVDDVARFNRLHEIYTRHAALDDEADFSERIITLIDRIVAKFPELPHGGVKSADITKFIYGEDINSLLTAVASYLRPQQHIWLLFDNIDKGWPALGAQSADIAIVRCLLEATRKFQNAIQAKGVEFNGIVFVRKDIYDLLVEQSSDRGKESIANLDWTDPSLMRVLVRKRFEAAGIQGTFEQIWEQIFTLHVAGQNSFDYLLRHTFMRPRDVLNFLRKVVQIAVSRGHDRVTEEDIITSEAAFSEDMLNDLKYEMRDVFPQYPNILRAFFCQPHHLSYNDIWLVVTEAGIKEAELPAAIDALLWFSFLGILRGDEDRYSYDVSYNLDKLKSLADWHDHDRVMFSIHPAVRSALETT